MKIVVISDTHGICEMLELVIKKTGTPDLLIHCGDIERQEAQIRRIAGCPCLMVAGNNDWGPSLPKEILTEIAGHRFYITHGHQQGVSFGYEQLTTTAIAKKADICLFGHTHRPMTDKREGCLLMNPGSLTLPRPAGRRPSYGILEIGEDGSVRYRIENL